MKKLLDYYNLQWFL